MEAMMHGEGSGIAGSGGRTMVEGNVVVEKGVGNI
jgi:hypothetical protein